MEGLQKYFVHQKGQSLPLKYLSYPKINSKRPFEQQENRKDCYCVFIYLFI